MISDEDKRWLKNNCKNDLFWIYWLLVIIGINSCNNNRIKFLAKDETGKIALISVSDFGNVTNTVKGTTP